MNQRQPLGSDPGLVAAANAADRRNRPAVLIVLGLVTVVAAAVFAVAGSFSFTAADTELDRERRLSADARRLVAELNQLQIARRSPGDYRNAGLMPQHLRTTASEVWNLPTGDQEFLRIVDIPASPERRPLQTSPGLNRADVSVRITAQPLETILTFVEEALNNEFLQTAFVTSITLDPAPKNWNATIEFRQYEQRSN